MLESPDFVRSDFESDIDFPKSVWAFKDIVEAVMANDGCDSDQAYQTIINTFDFEGVSSENMDRLKSISTAANVYDMSPAM